MATKVAKFAVGIARDDFAAITAEKFDGVVGFVVIKGGFRVRHTGVQFFLLLFPFVF